jgi:polynucleotide 5'-hydroxyl-kinase GRC3/NOL9
VAVSIHQEIAQQLAEVASVMLIGAIDTGKTTMARRIVGTAVEAGRTVGYVDADIGNSSIGPPSCVSLKVVRNEADLELLDRPG